MVQPSCPALVIHPDDAFRKALVVALDQGNFSVTVAAEGPDALAAIRDRNYQVVFVGLSLAERVGLESMEAIRKVRDSLACGVIILGDPDPALRTYAPWADETFLKPVDVAYVVSRAKRYCAC